jgi:hypothetical protein
VTAEVSVGNLILPALAARGFGVRPLAALDSLAHAVRRPLPAQVSHQNFHGSTLQTWHNLREIRLESSSSKEHGFA